jgi:PHP family Zn ribbon phosphoesterase
MLRTLKADLHVHTCLSPCADLGMSPRAIVKQALERGIDLIGITDHNSSENVPALMKAAQGTSLTVLPGMEATSKEEVHLLALFDSVSKAFAFQQIIYEHLPGENDQEAFGMQVVVNEESEVLRFNPRLLAGATDLATDQIVEAIHSLNGAAIASHIDREVFGIIGQLGFIPEGLSLDALELSPNTSPSQARQLFPDYARWAFVCSSDAHYVSDIGKVTTLFLLAEPKVRELKKAFRREEGRRVVQEDGATVDPARMKPKEPGGILYARPLAACFGHC